MVDSVQGSLHADTLEVQELFKRVRSGQVRVPTFQRGLKWGYSDVKTLFDSILRDFPIGNLLLWQRKADADKIVLGAIHVDAPAYESAWWVVDGQQRITSLYNALSEEAAHDERFALAYNINKGEIVRRATVDDPATIPLPVLFDLTRVLHWVRDYPEITDRIDEINSITARLRQFRIPIYLVEQADQSVLREIFDRMNNSGKKLTRAEVFSALNSDGSDDENIPAAVAQVSQETNFGAIDDDTGLLAFLARRGADVQREIRLEFGDDRQKSSEFPGESRGDALAGFEQALRDAVLFLQEHALVPHMSFLPYRYLLVVLTRFFSFHPTPGPRDLILLRRWYWRAALVGPGLYSGSTTGTTRQLNRKIVKGSVRESVDELLAAVRKRPMTELRPQNFRTNELTAKVVLCSWWAKHPRSPRTGEAYTISDLAELLGDSRTPADIVPRLHASSTAKSHYSWAANRVVLPDDDIRVGEFEQEARAEKSRLGEAGWVKFLESHLLTPQLLVDLVSEPDRFFVERQALIESDLANFVSTMCEANHEDTPPMSQLVFDLDEDA